MFGFEYHFDTHYVLCIASRYYLILDGFYVTFQGRHFGVFIVSIGKALANLTSLINPAILWTYRGQTWTERDFHILG